MNKIKENSSEYNYVYQSFINCQGKSVEIHTRLMNCKERCQRYNIVPNLLHNNSNKINQNLNISLNQDSIMTEQSMNHINKTMSATNEEIIELKDKIEELEEELEEAKDDNAELNQQLFIALQSGNDYI